MRIQYILFICVITFTFSCKKKTETAAIQNPASLTWTYKGENYVDNYPHLDTSDQSNFLSTPTPVLSGMSIAFSIISLVPNVYPVNDSATSNSFIICIKNNDSSKFSMAKLGQIVVTQSNNLKISGNFSVVDYSDTVKGVFNNVPITNY
jgi:hypothetical protein